MRRPLQVLDEELGLRFAASLGWFGTINGIDVIVRTPTKGRVQVTCAVTTGTRFALLRTRSREGLLAGNVRTGDADFDHDFHVTADAPDRVEAALDNLMRAALLDAPIAAVRGQDDHVIAVVTAQDDGGLVDAVVVATELARRFSLGHQAA